MNPHILVVEDDHGVAYVLQAMLQRSGYQVQIAYNGQTAQELIAGRQYDAAILDLNLGKGEVGGIELLALLSERSPDTAVILLTGYATLDSAIAAVRLGAYDYLIKPSSMTEIRRSVEQAIQKKIDANRKRHTLNQLEERLSHTLADMRQALGGQSVSQAPPATGRFIERGDLIVDLNRQVALVNHAPVDLTLIEYSLLAYLAQAAPRVVAPQELVSQVHGHASESNEASDLVRPHISRLRHKLRQAGVENVIQTIRGRGYALE